MNLIPAHYRNGSVDIAGHRLETSLKESGERAVVVGIRPGAVRIAANGIRATVELVEDLGDTAILDLDCGGTFIRARVSDGDIPREGAALSVTARAQDIHLFDKSDTQAVVMTAARRLRYQKDSADNMRSTREPAETNSRPLHIQVRETIRRQVKAGELIDKTGRLMTEAELGKHFGVSRITIRNAIKPLVDEGMFERERGRGTFLRTNQPENWVGRLMGFSETIKDAGYQPGAKVLLQGMTNKHDAEVRNQLRERAVWQLKRVRLADDIPIAIEHAFYPPDIGLELEKRDLTSIVMYRVFETEIGFNIKEATQTISASLADATSAKLLGVKAGSPLLSIERLTVNTDGRPLELLRSVYLPNYFRLSINLTRRHP